MRAYLCSAAQRLSQDNTTPAVSVHAHSVVRLCSNAKLCSFVLQKMLLPCFTALAFYHSHTPT